MAYFRKRAKGWQVQIEKLGVRDSQTFPTKAEAQAWAALREREIYDGHRGVLPRRTVSEMLDDYRDKVLPNKRASRNDGYVIERLRAALPCTNKVVSDVTAADFAAWRDTRTAQVQAATVNREWAVLRAAFQIACDEWGWLREVPTRTVKMPKLPPGRSRRVGASEEKAMLEALEYSAAGKVRSTRQQLAVAFLLAIETGMRRGEILGLGASDIRGRGAHLAQTKNGDARVVPLSQRALELLAQLPDEGPLFTLNDGLADHYWRLARKTVAEKLPAIRTLHFHDTRHEACTRLARKLSVLDLARVIGHRDLRSLQRYYNPTVDELADMLG